jgi:hypothetical protein
LGRIVDCRNRILSPHVYCVEVAVRWSYYSERMDV